MVTAPTLPVRDPAQYVLATLTTPAGWVHPLAITRDGAAIIADLPPVLRTVTKLGFVFEASEESPTPAALEFLDIADTVIELTLLARDYLTWGDDPATHRTIPMRAW